jgi:hypothetical protein
MSWKSEIDEIEERKRRAMKLAGDEAVAAQKVRRFVDLCDWLEWTKPLLGQQLGPRSYTFRP